MCVRMVRHASPISSLPLTFVCVLMASREPTAKQVSKYIEKEALGPVHTGSDKARHAVISLLVLHRTIGMSI